MFKFLKKNKDSYNYGIDWANLKPIEAKNINLKKIAKKNKVNLEEDGNTWEQEQSPLYYAVVYSSYEVVKNINLSEDDIDIQSAYKALLLSKYEIFHYFLSKGLNFSLDMLSAVLNYEKFTELYELFDKGSFTEKELSITLSEIIERYTKYKKAKPDENNYRRIIPYSSPEDENERYKIVSFLLEKGANPNFAECFDDKETLVEKLKDRTPPLHSAIMCHRPYSLISILIDKNMDVNFTNQYNQSALDCLVKTSFDKKLLRIFTQNASQETLDKALVFSCSDKLYRSHSHYPNIEYSSDENFKTIKYLIDAGANVNATIEYFVGDVITKYDEYTPLKAAILTTFPDCSIIDLLVDSGAKVEASYKEAGCVLTKSLDDICYKVNH